MFHCWVCLTVDILLLFVVCFIYDKRYKYVCGHISLYTNVISFFSEHIMAVQSTFIVHVCLYTHRSTIYFYPTCYFMHIHSTINFCPTPLSIHLHGTIKFCPLLLSMHLPVQSTFILYCYLYAFIIQSTFILHFYLYTFTVQSSVCLQSTISFHLKRISMHLHCTINYILHAYLYTFIVQSVFFPTCLSIYLYSAIYFSRTRVSAHLHSTANFYHARLSVNLHSTQTVASEQFQSFRDCTRKRYNK